MPRINELPSATTVTSNDLVPVFQDGKTKKVSATILSGPPGPTGATGPQGPIGNTGPTGPTGPSVSQVNADWNATSGVSQILNKPAIRQRLTASRTYYVRVDGSDSNTGLSNSSTGAFRTLQKAEDIASSLDNYGYDVFINIGAGTYTTNLVLRSFVGSGAIRYIGDNSNPSNILLQSSDGVIINSSSVTGLHSFSGITLSGSSSIGVVSAGKSVITLDNIRLGSLIYGFFALDQGMVTCGKLEIAGNMSVCLLGANQGNVQINPNSTVTLTGNPNFTGAFTSVDRLSIAIVYGITFVGSATGVRYNASSNGVVFTNGAGVTYLPGNSAGTVSLGGQYA